MKKSTRAEKLIKSHQKLFPKGVGIECGSGWLELIDLVCHYFEGKVRNQEVEAIQFAQIKEKFGLLRIYFDVQFNAVKKDDNRLFHELHSTIGAMEGVSSLVCEDCGKMKTEKVDVGMRTIHGWKSTLCNKCYIKRQERVK
jgi:hypothetical protein